MDGLMKTDEATFKLFRQCVLAVLNTGSNSDDASKLLEEYQDFDVEVVLQSRGLKINIFNAPRNAYVDGEMMESIKHHVSSVMRDIVFTSHEIYESPRVDFKSSSGLTDVVFRILRNANSIRASESPNLVVCWGGHSIDRLEYDYTKEVGYRLGLRGIDIGTGCGAGAMKGPMKGARIGHAKQKKFNGRYVGISEPGILVSEAPNPVVSELVILPDIEKRLEAFVRMAHAIIVFPGGAGTAEEVMYLLSILMQPENEKIPFPVIFTAPKERASYFEALDNFIKNTLGEGVCKHYQIIIDDPIKVSQVLKKGIKEVTAYREETEEMFGFSWDLKIPFELQNPFIPTHENMSALELSKDLTPYQLATNLRSAFSGIVAGNVKAYGQKEIKEKGPFQMRGDPALMAEIDKLLNLFIEQKRMKIGGNYQPCYEIV
jgi:predicted Rossmann-fold nucleotide-binding protein